MHHIIYKTTNLVNGKIYIGYHFQKIDPNEFDGYFGSGEKLLLAIKKYGKDNFVRQTLFVFEQEDIALAKEAEIVTEEFIRRRDVYNKTPGGGKPPSHKGVPKSEDHRRKIGSSNKGRIVSEETVEKIKQARAKQVMQPRSEGTKQKIANALYGVKHTDERRKNMSINHKDQWGEKNPMYGKKGSEHPAYGTKRELIECPHCNEKVPVNVAKRWHFDNCKSKTAKP